MSAVEEKLGAQSDEEVKLAASGEAAEEAGDESAASKKKKNKKKNKNKAKGEFSGSTCLPVDFRSITHIPMAIPGPQIASQPLHSCPPNLNPLSHLFIHQIPLVH